MWSACVCVCVCSPVRTCVDAMRCAGCSCVNNAVDGCIAGRSTPKRKASYSSHTSSYFSYQFHISSHVVTPGKVQFSLGMSVGGQSGQDGVRKYSFCGERAGRVEGKAGLNSPLNEGLTRVRKSLASTDCCSLEFLSDQWLNPSFILDLHRTLTIGVKGLGGSRVGARDAVCVIGCLCSVSGSPNFSCNTAVTAVTQRHYKSQ